MMAPNKTLGTDGFTTGFYQRHWDLFKGIVVPAVLNFLNGGATPEEVNSIVIVLIPKVKNPHDYITV